jgi:2-deoxy-D-gluconate 3-dehydrogenase
MQTPFDMFRLDNRVALITGGAGLLGREFCKTLAGAGAHVIIVDIMSTELTSTVNDLRDAGYSVSPLNIDITDPKSILQLGQVVRDQYEKVDVLVNSAALDPKFDPSHTGQHSTAFEAFPLEQWRQAMDVNLTGMFLVTQEVSKWMRKQAKGSIVNVCSTYGLVGPDQRIYPGEGSSKQYKPVYYSVTKAGVLGFTKYLASYYAGTEIRVNALTPGGVFNDHADEFVKGYSARTIMGRMADRNELNGALLFLASDASSYMTGANVIVDGGWTAW